LTSVPASALAALVLIHMRAGSPPAR
jgi:hypothetical protein